MKKLNTPKKYLLTTPIKLVVIGMISLISSMAHAQNWDEVIKVVASDRESGDTYGRDVAISGNYAIVGANLEDEDILGTNTLTSAGSAYILEQDGNGVWNEVQKIVASDRAADDRFGWSVAISGDYVVVGAFYEDEDTSGANTLIHAGSAYIFERDGSGNWNEVQKIVASDRSASDYFGYSVSISNGYTIVGAYNEAEDTSGLNTMATAGSAYIFERDGNGDWIETQKIVASDRGAGDNFGKSVAISSDYAIVGAEFDQEDTSGLNPLFFAGSAYLFERNGSGYWGEAQKIIAPVRAPNDYFGHSVSISGNFAVIGAYGEDEDAAEINTISEAGSAYIFARNPIGTWNVDQKIVASDREGSDNFGKSVSISSDHVVVGAYYEDHDTSGLNSLSRAGSAYLYERNVGIWGELHKIVASDRATNDRFGTGVAISGYTSIIGAYLEDHDTTGGNQLSNPGSVYLFEACPTMFAFNVTECTNYIVPSGDSTYTTIGTYTIMDTLINAAGCDSIMSISLTIMPPMSGVHNETVCFGDSIVVNGTTYNAANSSGTEVFTGVGPGGCDSTVTVNLTVLPALTGSVITTICNGDSVVVNGTTYNAANPSGNEVFSNIGSNSCDSTVTVNLTIVTIDTSVTSNSTTLTATQLGASYQWLDCNNSMAIISGETSSVLSATTNGSYAVELSLNGCADTSDCHQILSIGIGENTFANNLLVYPNPSDGNFSIQLDKKYTSILVDITDVSGKLIQSRTYNEQQSINIKLDNTAGLYFLTIKAGSSSATIRFVKN